VTGNQQPLEMTPQGSSALEAQPGVLLNGAIRRKFV
jgi:hypothetical protein